MVDWKKDLKLSDLLARKGDEPEFEVTNPAYEQPSTAESSDQLTPHGEAEPEDFETAREMSEPGEEERSTPFWKRELGFRRQKGEADPEDELETLEEEPEKRSFFKRELSFRRASDEAPTSDDELDVDAAEVESKPFWKRELSFGRRRDDDDIDTSEEFDREPASENGFEAEAAEKTPFWKRELSFGRRKDDDPAEDFDTDEDEQLQPGFVDESFVDQVEKTPFWKRGRRKSEFEEDAEQVEPQSHEEPFAEDAVVKTPFWKRDLGFGKRGSTEEAEPEESEAQDLEREEPSTPFWKRELSFGRRKDADDADVALEHEEPAGEEPEPVTAAAPEPVAIDDTPSNETFGSHEDASADATVEAAEAEPVTHEPVAASAYSEPEPQFEAEPEPEPISAFTDPEPVAADPDPLDAEPTHEHDFANVAAEDDDELFGERETETTDAPFWKREIKFGRRRGDDRLQPPTEFAAPLDEVDTFADLADDTERVPFWKRKLGRDEAVSSDAELDDDRESAKKSFFGLSLRREKDPDFEAPEPESTTPFWKRDLSFRRKDTGSQTSAARAGRSGRTKQLVGLKVGASQIAAARVVNNGSPELVQLARQSIEQGIVVGGELRDPDALAELLREFFTKNKLPNKNVRLGIGNNRIGVRSFEISGVHDPTQLENAIRFRAQEALPIPLDEAVLDYQVIDETVSPTGIRTYRVLLVVAYRELIDRYVAACRGAGLRLVGIDLEAFALLRAMAPPPAEGLPEDTALVAVAIGHDRSTFAVSSGAVCEFTRVLDWGGSSLNTAIARALDITPSQAEPVKRTLSLSDGESGDAAPSNEHTIRAEEAVRLELQTFARELVSSLHFYQNQPGSLAIGAITLTGGTAHLPGLAAELQRLIGVKVRVGDPLRRVKTAKRVDTPAQVGSMAVAIGLGIED